MPIVTGVRATKVYVMVWTVVLLASLIILQLYILQFGWWMAVIYSVILVLAPLVYLMAEISKATQGKDFARLSQASKFIMFTGILSMIFFRMYF